MSKMADNSTPENTPRQVENAKSSLTGILQSSLSPKYLHTNSTSHTWPFSAIAELIDNAYDPDVKASQLWIDKLQIRGKMCLSFTDNGFGMVAQKLHKMLSFGFCEKVPEKGYMPVGHYGNGFKSGSMRLGKDAIVLTKNETSRSIGYLSQTYLQAMQAETVVVPLATWGKKGNNYILQPEGAKALDDIMIFSLLRSEKDINDQFDKIPGSQGTRIIISSVRRTTDNKPEFDFLTDENDIRIPDDANTEEGKYRQTKRQNHIPECDYSLKAYCAILYLKPRMQIMLRGKKVKTLNVEKSLSQTEVDRYKPTFLGEPVKVVFGFNSLNKNHYGIMMYHRNRLIKPYERVGYQLKPNNLGVGVVGVVQCDFLQPTHNKQDFDYTKQYRTCMNALGVKLNEYWNEKKGIGSKTNIQAINQPIPEIEAAPDQIWVQCDEPTCLKWRKLPDSVNPRNLPDKWYCHMNPDVKYKSCDVSEEKDDDDRNNIIPYAKVQKRRLEKELQEKNKRARAETQAHMVEQEQKAKHLEQKEAALKQKEQALNKQLAEIESKPKVKTEGTPNKLPTAQVSPRPTNPKVSKPLKEVSPTLSHSTTRSANNQTPRTKSSPSRHIPIQPSPVQRVLIQTKSTPSPTKNIPIKSSPTKTPSKTMELKRTPLQVPNPINKYRQLSTQANSQSLSSPVVLNKAAPFVIKPATPTTKHVLIPVSATGVSPVATSTPQSIRIVTKSADGRMETGGVSIKVVKSSDGRTLLVQEHKTTTTSPGMAKANQIDTSAAKLLQNIGVTPTVNNAATTTLSSSATKTTVANGNTADVKPRLSVVLPKPQTRASSSTQVKPIGDRYCAIAPNTQAAKAFPQIVKAVSKTANTSKPASTLAEQQNKTIGIKREAGNTLAGSSPAKSSKLNTVIILDPQASEKGPTSSRDVESQLASCTRIALIEHEFKQKLDKLQAQYDSKAKHYVKAATELTTKKRELTETLKQLTERKKAVNDREKQLKSLRANVCRLLQVLVPEIDVDCEEGKGEGESVDELLKQVLEANQ